MTQANGHGPSSAATATQPTLGIFGLALSPDVSSAFFLLSLLRWFVAFVESDGDFKLVEVIVCSFLERV